MVLLRKTLNIKKRRTKLLSSGSLLQLRRHLPGSLYVSARTSSFSILYSASDLASSSGVSSFRSLCSSGSLREEGEEHETSVTANTQSCSKETTFPLLLLLLKFRTMHSEGFSLSTHSVKGNVFVNLPCLSAPGAFPSVPI